MPLILDNTEVEVVQEKITNDFNKIEITGHFVDNKSQQILVTYDKLLDDTKLQGESFNLALGIDGNMGIIGVGFYHIISGNDFLTIALGAPGGPNRYTDTKVTLYNYMTNQLGLVGTVV